MLLHDTIGREMPPRSHGGLSSSCGDVGALLAVLSSLLFLVPQGALASCPGSAAASRGGHHLYFVSKALVFSLVLWQPKGVTQKMFFPSSFRIEIPK